MFNSLFIVHLFFIGGIIALVAAGFIKKDKAYFAPAALIAFVYFLAWIFGAFS